MSPSINNNNNTNIINSLVIERFYLFNGVLLSRQICTSICKYKYEHAKAHHDRSEKENMSSISCLPVPHLSGYVLRYVIKISG
jgi:hypothetical protein